MKLNPTVNCYHKTPIVLQNDGNSFPYSQIYTFQHELPNNINITLANTNLSTNYIVHDSNELTKNKLSSECRRDHSSNSNVDEKRQRKKSKDFANCQEELKKEKMKNEMLILKIVELEKLMNYENKRNFMKENKNNENKQTNNSFHKVNIMKTPAATMEKDKDVKTNEDHQDYEQNQKINKNTMIYIKNLEIKIENILTENERISKLFHGQYMKIEQLQNSLEEKYDEQNTKIEKLLVENEKLMKFVDEMRTNYEKKIKEICEENKNLNQMLKRLQTENNVILNSIAIINEKQQIEKNKIAVISEQNSYLENKIRILHDENQKLKGKI